MTRNTKFVIWVLTVALFAFVVGRFVPPHEVNLPVQTTSHGSPQDQIPEQGIIDATVAAFKAEFVKEGSLVLDAWWNRGFIVVYINGLEMADRQEELSKVPAPGEYQGLPTVLTLFPRQ